MLDAVEHGDALIYGTVDQAVVAAARAADPYLADRREDLYRTC